MNWCCVLQVLSHKSLTHLRDATEESALLSDVDVDQVSMSSHIPFP